LGERWAAGWRPNALRPLADRRWHHGIVEGGGRKLILLLAGCWTAFLASTPAAIGYFQLFSPGSILANLLVIPLATLAIWAGFVSLLAGLAWLGPVAIAANRTAALLIETMDWLLRLGTTLPGMWLPARFRAEWLGPAALVLMIAVMLAGAAAQWRRRFGGFWPPAVALALILILGVKFG
jgi:competence protein ComEC